jgi:hypothetical protein
MSLADACSMMARLDEEEERLDSLLLKHTK